MNTTTANLQKAIDSYELEVAQLNSQLLTEGISKEEKQPIYLQLKKVHAILKILNAELQSIYRKQYQTA